MTQEYIRIETGAELAQRCGICHDRIGGSEHATVCPACGLQNHTDCWQENLGCGAYGCAQVNSLKSGPDISVALPPLSSDHEINTGRREPATASYVAAATVTGIPWEHGLLAVSTVAALLSLVLFGWPSAILWLVTRTYTECHTRSGERWLVLVSEAVNVVGFLVGQRLSTWL